jgi:hypothetical protein
MARTLKLAPQRPRATAARRPKAAERAAEAAPPAAEPETTTPRTARLLATLAEDFARHGSEVIERVRRDKPVDYLRLVAAVLPKEVATPDPVEGLTDAELAAAIVQLRTWLADIEAARGAAGGALGVEPARDL